MRLLIALSLFLGYCGRARAETSKGLEETMESIASDLATLHKEIEHIFASTHARQTPERIRLVGKKVSVFKAASDSSGVLLRLPEGKTLPVVDRAGDWYAVRIDSADAEPTAGWVPARAVAPVPTLHITAPVIFSDELYQRTLVRVQKLRDSYKDNPYVQVAGFTVEISLPPSVSIDFAFK